MTSGSWMTGERACPPVSCGMGGTSGRRLSSIRCDRLQPHSTTSPRVGRMHLGGRTGPAEQSPADQGRGLLGEPGHIPAARIAPIVLTIEEQELLELEHLRRKSGVLRSIHRLAALQIGTRRCSIACSPTTSPSSCRSSTPRPSGERASSSATSSGGPAAPGSPRPTATASRSSCARGHTRTSG
jgi:hypothetical protein